jgi:hypothetical protein
MVPSTYPCHADLSSTALRAHRPAGPVHAHRRRAHPCAIVPSSLNIPPPDCVASRGRVPTQVALASGRKQESRPAGVSRSSLPYTRSEKWNPEKSLAEKNIQRRGRGAGIRERWGYGAGRTAGGGLVGTAAERRSGTGV